MRGTNHRSASGIPRYLATADEVELFLTAYDARLPVMLVGPTGCGKTRFVTHMAARLERTLRTIVGHDDLTTSDLVGRFLVRGGDVEWRDGPLTTACRNAEICYIDEVVEVRREALAVLHPLADDRRELHLDRKGETVPAEDGFILVCSYNPGRSVGFRELRPAFRQRFVTIPMTYLPAPQEAEVVVLETGVDQPSAARLVRMAGAMREAVADHGGEAPSTRMLVYAGQLIARGTPIERAVESCIVAPLTQASDASEAEALRDLAAASY